MSRRLVFLVPGFFGFTSFGALSYFEDVEQALARELHFVGHSTGGLDVRMLLTPGVRIGMVPVLSQMHGAPADMTAPRTWASEQNSPIPRFRLRPISTSDA